MVTKTLTSFRPRSQYLTWTFYRNQITNAFVKRTLLNLTNTEEIKSAPHKNNFLKELRKRGETKMAAKLTVSVRMRKFVFVFVPSPNILITELFDKLVIIMFR